MSCPARGTGKMQQQWRLEQQTSAPATRACAQKVSLLWHRAAQKAQCVVLTHLGTGHAWRKEAQRFQLH
jgi:hypothetical protein